MTRQDLSHRMMGTSESQRLRLQLVAADFLERMGARMRQRREELKLSRAEVARRMPGKVNENQVYRWEKGLHQPNPDTLEALAEVLTCEVSYFMSPKPDKGETPEPFASDESSQLDRMEAKLNRLQAVIELLAGGEIVAAALEELQRAEESADADGQQSAA